MNASVASPHAESRIPTTHVVVFAVVVLALRVVGSNVGRFSEGDEISLAAGIAGVVRGIPVDTYRYAVQFGYYHLVAAIVALLGGDPSRVPIVMGWLSIMAGVVIPVAGLLAFREWLSLRQRWLLAALLAANPIIWMSSRYGNTAMVSVALTVVAIGMLSNRPTPRREWSALALFGCAILVRADAVLVSGAILALLWHHHRRLTPAVVRLGVVAGAVMATLLFMQAADPRMGSVARSLVTHVSNPISTRFFEYLLWAVSPFPLLLAAVGLRELQRDRHKLVVVLLAWIGIPFLFYFTSTTTPRYLLQGVFPLSVAAAVGMSAFLAAPASPFRRFAAWCVVLTFGFLHLFIGLSHFSPSPLRSILTDAAIPSDDGPVWTGALLFKSYRQRPLELARLARGRFRAVGAGEITFRTLFDSVGRRAPGAPPLVLAAGRGYGNTMHYFATVGGAALGKQAQGSEFNRETEFVFGPHRVATVGLSQLHESGDRLTLHDGDELWVVDRDSATAMRELGEHLPSGVQLTALPAWPSAPRLMRFVAGRTP